MWGKWNMTDPDCAQFIRRNGNKFDMIQIVDIDMFCFSEDSKFAVVRKEINMNDYSDNEIIEYVSMYYSDEEIKTLDDFLVAECILEQEIICGDNAIFEADSFEEAFAKVKEIINNEND